MVHVNITVRPIIKYIYNLENILLANVGFDGEV